MQRDRVSGNHTVAVDEVLCRGRLHDREEEEEEKGEEGEACDSE